MIHTDVIPQRTEKALAPEHDADQSPHRFSHVADERSIEYCECVIDIVAALFGVSSKELRRPGRASASIARVRQIAMYVCHVVLRLNLTEVGRGFGRDRTTVQHACHLVEDLRDDVEFDRMVAMTERVVAAALRGWTVR